MAQVIQFKRGVDSARQTVCFRQGEPVYITDTNKFYIGDGITTGGLLLGGNFSDSESYTIVETTDSETTNGLNLLNVVNSASSKTPYGRQLSFDNPYNILLPPAIYNFGNTGIIILNEGINIYGLGEKNQVILEGTGSSSWSKAVLSVIGSTVIGSTNKNIFKNFTIKAKNYTESSVPLYIAAYSSVPVSGLVFEDVNLYCEGDYGDSTIAGQILQGKCVFRMGTYFDGISFKNVNTSGGAFLSSTAVLNSRNIYLENVNSYGDLFFSRLGGEASTLSPEKALSGSVFAKNCNFYGNSGFYSQNAKIMYGASFDNCYFSGTDMFHIVTFNIDRNKGVFGNFNNCIFEGSLSSGFRGGIMNNCVIDTRSNPSMPAIILKNPSGSSINLNKIPTFKNCLFLSSHAVCVSGMPTSGNQDSSGIFINCQFNGPVSTGITGILASVNIGNSISTLYNSIRL